MAKPQESYPTTATHGGREDTDTAGRNALEDALSEHGGELAALVQQSDELADVLTTAILIAASADEDDVQHVTDTTANLVEAAEGLSTDGMATLATELGENADDLSDSLETVVELQRTGQLDDLARVATALTDSLSPAEIDDLATLLDESGGDLVDMLDVVLELQRAGDLEPLVETAQTLSQLDLDPDAVEGMNGLVDALGQAQWQSEPRGLVGTISALQSSDFRAGLGYVVSLLKALGRSARRR
jgi:uncharacterized protein YjgD (DUF1641 family)